MPQTRPNGIIVPVNADGYNLTADLATMADKANVVVSVPNQTARDALTGGVVTRGDVPGQAVEIYNGSSWDRIGPVVQASTQIVGSGMAANAFTTGTKRPFRQSGSTVTTTDAAGNIAITYPVAFPNGVITAVVCNGDSNTGNLLMSLAGAFTQTVSTLFVNVRVANTGAVVGSSSVRVNWIVDGW